MNPLMYILRAPVLLFVFFAVLSSAAGSDLWCYAGSPLGCLMVNGRITVNSKGYIFSTDPITLRRSTDQGSSWQELFVYQETLSVVLRSLDDNTLIFVADEMRRSDDDGESWTVISPYPGFQGLHMFRAASAGTIVIPSGDTVYISHDRGDTWRYKIFAVDNPPGHFRSLADILAADNGDIYARCNHSTREDGGPAVIMPDELYVLRKDSDTWVQLPTPDITKLVPLAVDNNGDIYAAVNTKQIGRFDPESQSWTIRAPGLDKDVSGCRILPDGRVYICTIRSLYQTTDKGITWQDAWRGLPRDYMLVLRSFEVGKNLAVYVSTMYHGLFMLPAPEAVWQPIGADMKKMPVSELLALPESNRLFAISYYNGFHRSDDGGVTWQRMPLQRQSDGTTILNFPVMDIIRTTSGTLYAAAGAEGIFMSEDNGDSWSQIAYLWSSIASISFETLAVAADGSLIASYGLNGRNYVDVFKSVDGGITWTKVFEDGYRIVKGGGTTLFLSNQKGLYRSSDHGDSWEPVDIPGMDVDAFIYEMIYTGDNHFFLATTEGIWLSDDNGVSWSVYGLRDSVCTALFYTARGHLLVVTYDDSDNHHVMRTEDQGKTWQDITSNLSGTGEIATLAETADGWLYAGGSMGVFKNCVASGIGEQVSVPSVTPLLSCFPNPASGSVSISYQLIAPAHVSVKIIDLAGREIAVLIDEWKSSGAHSYEWKYDLPEGMYLVVINSGAEPVIQPVYCR